MSVTLGGVLREWDRANQDQRKLLLESFCELTQKKTALQLSDELGHSTALLLARFLASFRLRYNRSGVRLLLDAIHRFTSSAGGLEYIDELTESGCIITVIETIGLSKPTEIDKCAALRVLQSVAHGGIRYKEVLCRAGVIRTVCECLARALTVECRAEASQLLSILATGNPRYADAVYRSLIALLPADSPNAIQIALQLLRKLQNDVEPIKELAAPLLGAMGSYHGEVRYEARLYLVSLSDSSIAPYLIAGLLRALSAIDGESGLSDWIRQACAAATCHDLVEQKSVAWVQKFLIAENAPAHLIYALANVEHAESQRNASLALRALANELPDEWEGKICDALGPLAPVWLDDPVKVIEEIDAVKADALKSTKTMNI